MSQVDNDYLVNSSQKKTWWINRNFGKELDQLQNAIQQLNERMTKMEVIQMNRIDQLQKKMDLINLNTTQIGEQIQRKLQANSSHTPTKQPATFLELAKQNYRNQ